MAEQKGGKLGLFACISIIVGGCIGSAIFSLSGQTMFDAGPACLVSWAVAAIILALYGMQVCELAVRYPQSGGIFVFPQKAIGGTKGNFFGFLSAWGYIVSNSIAVAFSAIYVSIFLGQGFPSLANAQIPLALGACLVCLILNLIKVTDAGKFNTVLVTILVSTMLLFVGFALFSGKFETANFNNFFTTGLGVKGMFKSIPVAAVAYGSCVAISFMVGDVKNPNRTIPRSLFIGLILVMILYLLMIFATIGTCSYTVLEQNPWLVYAPQFGSINFGGLSAYPFMSKVVAIAACLALLTTMLVLSALNARAIQAVASSGYLPKVLAKENKNSVPGYATLVTVVIAGLLSCKPSWTETLVGLGALFNVISMLITCVSLIVSRKKLSLEEGQYHAPFGNFAPIFTVVVLGTCYIFGSVDKNVVIFTVLIYFVGNFIFYFFSKKNGGAK